MTNLAHSQNKELLDCYFSQLQNNPRLTDQETNDLFLLIKNKDDSDAIKKICLGNLRLVVTIAKNYQGKAEFLDLIQAGNLGLRKSVKKYQLNRGRGRGMSFGSYASWWIRKEINIFLTTNNFIKLTSKDRLNEERAIVDVVSLNKPLSNKQERENGFGFTLEDIICEEETPETKVETKALENYRKNRVRQILSEIFPDRDRKILEIRFGINNKGKEGSSLKQIGNKLGISGERARQIEKRALRKFKNLCCEEDFIF